MFFFAVHGRREATIGWLARVTELNPQVRAVYVFVRIKVKARSVECSASDMQRWVHACLKQQTTFFEIELIVFSLLSFLSLACLLLFEIVETVLRRRSNDFPLCRAALGRLLMAQRSLRV